MKENNIEETDLVESNVAEPGNYFYPAYSSSSEDEPLYQTQKQLTFDHMSLGQVPSYYRGDSVKVAVIDSGLYYTHEDFKLGGNSIVNLNSCSVEWDSANSKWLRYLYSNNTSHLNDSLGHGTNAASVIASQINSLGAAGIAPNVDLYIYKVTNSNNGYEWGAIQTALTDCINQGVDVINMSFQAYEHSVTYNGSTMTGSSGCSTILSSWLNSCYNAGITLVAAAGNYNTSEPSYPASNNHVISVGSLARASDTAKAGYSNTYGIDLVAPGSVHVANNLSNSAYKETQGTSFSAPIVTAAIALYKQQNPSATPAQIESALKASCDPISGNPSWAGSGKLNISKFLGVDEEEEPEPTDYVSSVEITNVTDNQLEMEVGDEFTLQYNVNGVGSYSSQVRFELDSDEGILSVNSYGKITALKTGTDFVSVISTQDESKYDFVEVTVTQSVPTTLTLSPSALNLDVGDNAQLTATTNSSNTVTYSSNNTAVATVNSSGLVTAVKEGSATITATVDGVNATCSVTVNKSSSSVPAGTYTLTYSNFSGSYPTNESNISFTPFVIKAKEVMQVNLSGTKYIQFKSTPGYLYNYDPVNVESITINVNSGSFKVYGGSTLGNYTEISATNGVYNFPSSYIYFKISSNNTTGRASSINIVVGDGKEMTGIAVKTAPSKLLYEEGEYFVPTGLVLTATYEGGSTKDISYASRSSDFSFSPSLTTQLVKSNTSVTITFNGHNCSQPITVVEPVTLSSIEISGQTTSFTRGDTFTFGGMVSATFSDKTITDVTSSVTFTGYSMTTVGEQTVTASYTYKGTTKTATYTINVNAGTLTSISLSGQTTSYTTNSPFTFTGICTAYYANGFNESVTPTSVTSPNMTTNGVKEITVSFTYGAVTKTATYNIVVSRVVTETTTTKEEGVLGTITYPDNKQTISISTLSVSTGGYTNIESNSIRLGSGSNVGSVTVTSTTSNIVRVVVSAKAYSGDSNVTLTIGGTSNTLTSTYSNYQKIYSTAVNSVTIATTAQKKRAHIQSITIYEMKDIETVTDISSSEDCVGLETFISTYMHMDYVDNLGYCKDNTHHYYSDAKAAFNALNSHQRSLFVNNEAYLNEYNRLRNWATANGEEFKSNNTLDKKTNIILFNNTGTSSGVTIGIIAISIMAVTFLGCYFYKKKHS